MEAASKCSTRSEFKSKFPTARKHAIENGWLDEINVTYFPEKASSGKQNRVYTLYVYEFPELKTVYTGLAFDIEYRKKKHQTSTTDELAVFCIQHNLLLPEMKIIETGITSNAVRKHCELYEQYTSEGWNMLNQDPVTNIPNYVPVTKERAFEAAKQCTSLSDFRARFYVEYRHAKKNNWDSEYTWFKRPVTKAVTGSKVWDREHTYEEAKKYKTITEFAKNCDAGYRSAKKYGWLDDYTWFEKKMTSWTEEMVVEISKNYKTLNDFRNSEPRAYNAAKKNKWLAGLTWLQRKETLTKERAFEISRQYKTYNDFKTGETSVYSTAAARGWLKEITWLERVHFEYTREYCEGIAREYTTTSQLKENNPKVYKKCVDNNWIPEFEWLDDDIKRMEDERIRAKEEKERLKNEIILKQTPDDLEENSDELSYEECYDEAERCSSMKKFAYTHPYCYYKAKKMNWLADYVWLTEEYDESTLTFEHCKEEAAKYNDVATFRKKCPLEYWKAKREKWLVEFDWARGDKPRNYWTYERCCECAEKCAYRSDFRYRYPSAYKYAKKNGLYTDIVKKYFPQNLSFEYDEEYVYTIYAYEIESTHAVYVGVTHIPASRDLFHKNAHHNKYKTRLAKYCESIGMNSIPEVKIVEDNIPPEQASEKEIYWYGKYKNEGWNMINLEEKLGLLGRQRKKWTYEESRQCALMCRTNKEFRENYRAAYRAAHNHKWISDFIWLAETPMGPKRKWSEEHCRELAEQYTTLSGFKKNEPIAYEASKTYGYLDKFDWLGNDVVEKTTIVKKWSEQECERVSHECSTISDFRKKYDTAYRRSKENGWLEKFVWLENECVNTYEDNYEIAKKYTTMYDFRMKECLAYNKANKEGWLKDYTWLNTYDSMTYEDNYAVAKKYATMNDFRIKDSFAYKCACESGWLKNYTWLKHNDVLTYEENYAVAQRYDRLSEFKEKEPTAHNRAQRNGWLKDYTWLKRGEDVPTYEENYEIAKKYTLMNDFRTKEVTAYKRAQRLGWLKDYTWLKRVTVAQTFEEVEATARKYSSMDDFYNNDTQTYKVARKNGWIDKFDWLKRKHRPRWTFETAAQEASKYSSRSELLKKDPRLYTSARKHKWLDMFVFSGELSE